MLLGAGTSSRTDQDAIRPCSGLNTSLFCHLPMTKILGIDRSIRLSNFPPKSQQEEISSPLWLSFPACRFKVDSFICGGDLEVGLNGMYDCFLRWLWMLKLCLGVNVYYYF